MSLYNSNNGQRRLRFNFGKKFTPKPLNPELSEQENMMNMIKDYRQWQQDNPQPDCSNMSTREILEAVVSDFRAQQREEEEAKKAAQMQRSFAPMQNAPAYVAQRAYVPAGQATYGATEQIAAAQQVAQPQESLWQKGVRHADYMSTAARQGLSYGWSDELEGGIGGISYAVGSLVPSWNKNNESMVEAFKRGYITHRDEERQKLEEGRKNVPVLTMAAEAAGGGVSPFSKFLPTPNAPYLNAVKKIPLKNIAKAATIYGTGAAEHGNSVGETLGNYAENIGIGAIGGTAGHNIGKLMFGRSNFPPERGLYEQTVGTVMGGVYNMLNKR